MPPIRKRIVVACVEGNCAICGIWRKVLAIDHIIPFWKYKRGLVEGDPDAPSNIQLLCDNCHADKTRDEKPPMSDEGREKIRQKMVGRVFSEEHKARLSQSLLGKKFSEERKANISAARTGQKLTEEHIEAIRRGLKGRVFSEQHRARLREAAERRRHSKRTPIPPHS